jgi:hypothetical protein
MDPTRVGRFTGALIQQSGATPTRRFLLTALAGGLTATGILGASESSARRRKKRSAVAEAPHHRRQVRRLQ